MKKFKWGWYLLLALAITTLICLVNPLIYLFRFRGFVHNVLLGFIIAIPLAFMVKAKN